MKLHHRDDEEPDFGEELVPHHIWLQATAGLCGFCGREGHKKIDCPVRPLGDHS